MPVKTHMIISTKIHKNNKERPNHKLKAKPSKIMKRTNNKINKTKNPQILIGNRSAPVPKPLGRNFKEGNKIRNNENISTKPRRRNK
jgi:hypothetical protein